MRREERKRVQLSQHAFEQSNNKGEREREREKQRQRQRQRKGRRERQGERRRQSGFSSSPHVDALPVHQQGNRVANVGVVVDVCVH